MSIKKEGIQVGDFRQYGKYQSRILPWTSERKVILARCKPWWHPTEKGIAMSRANR